jgi:hypothetical protein
MTFAREGRLRLIVDGIPALVALLTPAGTLELVNHEVMECSGGESTQATRITIAMVLNPARISRNSRTRASSRDAIPRIKIPAVTGEGTAVWPIHGATARRSVVVTKETIAP